MTVTVAKPGVAARIYLLRDGGKVWPVSREVPSTQRGDLLDALYAGPTSTERRSGFSTDVAAAMPQERLVLAQEVFTLSQFDPTAPVVIGGKSYSRSDFEDETPIILVESPLPFTRVTSPLRVTGTADTFEATFDYDLVAADGKVLAHHFVTATSGNGARGTFDFTARFTVPSEQQGKLVVYELSAKDGSRIHQSEIPLTLEP